MKSIHLEPESEERGVYATEKIKVDEVIAEVGFPYPNDLPTYHRFTIHHIETPGLPHPINDIPLIIIIPYDII